jgi:hypothetical protein
VIGAFLKLGKLLFGGNPDGSRGAVLVEFAFSIPVLLMVLYYVLDYPNYMRLKSKTRNSAYMAVSMIQNISRHRENKKITLQDIQRINYVSFLNYCCGKQQLKTTEDNYIYPLGHLPLTVLICVKGVADNKCKVVWSLFASGFNATSPLANGGTIDESNFSQSSLTTAHFHNWTGLSYQHGVAVAPKSIHPELQILQGEIKIVLMIARYGSLNFKYADGTKITANPRKLFGFYMLPLRLPISGDNVLFRNIVTFTPNPDLFDETPPK